MSSCSLAWLADFHCGVEDCFSEGSRAVTARSQVARSLARRYFLVRLHNSGKPRDMCGVTLKMAARQVCVNDSAEV